MPQKNFELTSKMAADFKSWCAQRRVHQKHAGGAAIYHWMSMSARDREAAMMAYTSSMDGKAAVVQPKPRAAQRAAPTRLDSEQSNRE